MFRSVTGLVVGATLVLTACGSDNGKADQTDGTTTYPTKGSGPLSALSSEALCGMVDGAMLEKEFGEPFVDPLDGVNPPEQRGSVVCLYVTKAFSDAEVDQLDKELQVTTKVTVATDVSTPQEALDAYMTNMDGEVVAYEPVDGLGVVAGFAGDALGVRQDGSHLAAIVEVGDALIEVVVRAEPERTLEQLRPIADELLPKVESELR